MNKEAKSAYFDLPALDVSVAFPQATPASVFPPSGKLNDFCCFVEGLKRSAWISVAKH